MNIILIGPAGSGKGSQAERVAKKYNMTVVEIGGQARKAAKEDSDRGRLINKLINKKGELLPDGIIFQLTKDYLEKLNWKSGLIFDGYPRSVKQFILLEDYLVDKDEFLHLAIYLEISDAIAIERLSNRVICQKCGTVYNLKTDPPPKKNACKCGGKLMQRPDEKPEAIKTRLKLFREVTKPVLNLMKEKGILEGIDGSRSEEEIFEEIQRVIGRKSIV